MPAVAAGRSVLAVLATIPDSRGRHGRRYPRQPLLAVLMLAALTGQGSLGGMGRWARAHAAQLPWPCNRLPALATFWTLLCRLDRPLLLETVTSWRTASRAERVSREEKGLRGSTREGAAPRRVVAALGQRGGLVLGQRVAEGPAKPEAARALLARLPLAGTLWTREAGLRTPPVVQQGAY